MIDDEDPRMAVVSQGGLFGYADLEQGRLLLPPVYQDAGPFREGLAVVRLGDRFGLIDRDGVWRVDCGRYDYVGPLSGGPGSGPPRRSLRLHRPPRSRGDSREVSVRL